MTEPWTIAIDGPSGTGKSTIARQLAEQLGASYLDTGAMYRIAALAVLRAGVDPADSAAVAQVVQDLVFDVPLDPQQQRHLLAGVDVTEMIRGPEVTGAVTPVSANPAVRQVLSDRQRQLIAGVRMVAEGRDVGTVIAPQAELKIYLTADEDIRVQRRQTQNADDPASDLRTVAESIRRRDIADSTRTVAPLTAADDAVLLDTSALSIAQTLAAAMEIAAERGLG